MFSVRTKAEIALIFATLVWGLTFPFIRISLADLTPTMIVFLRGLLASVVFIPFVFSNEENRKNFLKLLPIGFLLGFFYYTSYFAQAIGLETISSGRSAFLTNLTVIFVPLFSHIFKRGQVTSYDLISCAIALVGMLFLTNPFGSVGFGAGDLWTILCAFLFTLQIQLLHIAMLRNPHSSVLFSFLQVALLTSFSSLSLPFTQAKNVFHMHWVTVMSLLYLGIVALVLTTWIQTRYQYQTTPERASIIYMLEPAFACLFGYLLLNETLTIASILGGFLMIFAVVWVPIFKFVRRYFHSV